MRLAGKVAIVTASTKGIGLATVKAFAAEGATVYMAVRNPELGNEVAATIEGNVKVVYMDAFKFECYEPMVDAVMEAEGRIDILVNNFGGTNPGRDLDIIHGNVDRFNKDVNVNVGSVYHATNLVLNKAMLKQKSGSIINISSVAGISYDYKQCAYGVAKSGINHLSKMIAVQTGRYGIRCNVVSPGMTATDAVTNNLPEDYMMKFQKATPLVRMATPEEIAAAVLYFASDESAFTTGQNIAVEGGYSFAPGTYGDDIGARVIAKK